MSSQGEIFAQKSEPSLGSDPSLIISLDTESDQFILNAGGNPPYSDRIDQSCDSRYEKLISNADVITSYNERFDQTGENNCQNKSDQFMSNADGNPP